MDGKKPLQEHISVRENLLYNIYFLLINKFSRISYTSLHLYLFLLFFQMLMKYLKINVLYEWTALSRQVFRQGFTSRFIVKGERFYDYFSVVFLGKNSNFLLLNLTTSSKNWGSLWGKKLTKAIKQIPSIKTSSKSDSFYLKEYSPLKENTSTKRNGFH